MWNLFLLVNIIYQNHLRKYLKNFLVIITSTTRASFRKDVSGVFFGKHFCPNTPRESTLEFRALVTKLRPWCSTGLQDGIVISTRMFSPISPGACSWNNPLLKYLNNVFLIRVIRIKSFDFS